MIRENETKKRIERERMWLEMIEEARESGLPIREYCQKQGITEDQFYRWKRRLRNKLLQRPRGSGSVIQTIGHVPLQRAPKKSTRAVGRVNFALVTEATTVDAGTGIEILLPGGWRVRIGREVEAQTLALVLSVLEERRC